MCRKMMMLILLGLTTACLSAGQAGLDRQQAFAEIDAQVRAFPKAASVKDVVKRIAAIADTDLEKVRAVYIWMTANIAYDVESFFSGNYRSTEAGDVFKYGSSVCQGYSNLFAELCRGLKIKEVVVIAGYAKAYSYAKGQGFTATNHAWNAVRIDGQWTLFDSTWGAGYVDGKNFVRRYAELWFDTDPELFRINHLPEDPDWQLTEPKINLKTYVGLPFMKTYEVNALYSLGYSAGEIAALYKEGSKAVTCYSYPDYEIRLDAAPIRAELTAGTEYTFTIYAPQIAKAAFIANTKWIMLDNKDGYFTATLKPDAGKLMFNVYILYNKQQSYWNLLEYTVK